MRKRPILLLACIFLAGILAGEAWYLLPAVLALFVYVLRRERGKRRRLLIFLIPFLFAAGMLRMGGEMRFRMQYLPELRDGQEVRLAGEIVRIEEKSRFVCYVLTDCVMQSSSCVPCNDVLAYASTDEFSVGQILVVRGTVALFDERRNEGQFDARGFYQSRKIDFALWVTQAECADGNKSPWKQFLASLRTRLACSIAGCGARDGVLSAMLLGERSTLDAEVKTLYQRAGISHILAISGLHISMLGMGLYHMLRKRLRYLSAGMITAVFMMSYAYMTGFGVSVRRALGMLLVLLAGDVLGSGYDMLSALGLLCIILLWDNPFCVYDSGFWFSVTAVLGIGVVGAQLARFVARDMDADDALSRKRTGRSGAPEKKRGRCGKKLAENLCVSLGIQLATLPLSACCYYEVPVYALFLNTLILPFAKYLLGIGFAAAVVGLWCVPAGRILMTFCNWILLLYEKACTICLALPGARVVTGHPAPWQLFLYYSLLTFVVWHMHRRTTGRVQGEARGALRRCAVSVLCVCLLFAVLTVRLSDGLRIDVLDVGQGDGICVRTEEGISLFIDGGSSDVSAVGTYRILPFLKYNGVKKISYWFVSHADSDHVSGLMEVLGDGYPVEHLVFAEAVRGEEKTMELAELARRAGCEVLYMKPQDVLVVGEVRLRCLAPIVPPQQDAKGTLSEGGAFGGDLNGLSLVLLLEYGSFSGIFTGDITAEMEARLAECLRGTRVDFYKAAHHGSRNSNSEALLQALAPKVAVISCGEGNRYGHPHKETLERLAAAGTEVYRTDEGGQISVRVRNGRMKVRRFVLD